MSKSNIHLIVDSGPKQGETLDRKPGSLIKIGRVVRGNTLAIKDLSISQHHIVIEFDPQISRWTINDLNTSNGTSVNGGRIPCSAPFCLSDGDCLKIGESTSISIRILVQEENVGGRKGRGRAKKDLGGCEEKLGVLNGSEREGDESSVKAVEPVIEASKHLERARRTRRTIGLKNDENVDLVVEDRRGRSKNASDAGDTLDLGGIEEKSGDSLRISKESGSKGNDNSVKVVEPAIEASKKLERGRRTRQTTNLKEDEVGIEVAEKLGRTRRRNAKTDLKKNEILDSTVATENLVRGKKGELARGSKKDLILDSSVDDGVKVMEKLGRTTKRNGKSYLKKNETLDSAIEDRTETSENLKRGNREKLARADEISDIVLEVKDEVPKNLGRGRSASSTHVSEKDVSLDLVLENSTAQPENLGRSQLEDVHLKPIVEDSTDAPRSVGRGRKTYSARFTKSDEVKGSVAKDNTQVQRNFGKGRRTRSTKVSERDDNLDSVIEDKIQVPNNVGKGRRAGSTRVTKADETLVSIVEDKRESPKKSRRGKARSDSSNVSNKDGILDAGVENSIQIVKNVGRGRGGRAPSRRTRASSRALKEDTVLNPVENLHKEQKSVKNKRRQESENRDESDKENYISAKWQKTSHVFPKTWNGNGIPNTTNKYKEDQKVSFHATPFEERLEKALSDDKLFPERKFSTPATEKHMMDQLTIQLDGQHHFLRS